MALILPTQCGSPRLERRHPAPYISYMSAIRHITAATLLAATLAVYAVPAHAKADPVQTNWSDNLAAEGYDVVSFFSGKPQIGKVEYNTRYLGAEWQFISQANLDLFLTNPEMFAPQYGGYCAWAVARGKVAKGDPDVWHVEDGRLFFNFNDRIQRRWTRKRTRFIRQADKRWPNLVAD